MSRASLLAFLVFIPLVAGLVAFRGPLLALTIPLFLYWLYSLLRGPDDLRVEIERQLSADRVSPETPVIVKLTITNSGHDLEELALEDMVVSGLAVVEGSNRHIISLSAGGSFTFEYKVQGSRGSFAFETLHVEAGDHLGLVRVVRELRTHGQLAIFPHIARIKHFPIRPRRTRVYAGSIPARVGGPGVEFFGVRDYESGDAPRRINWHVSARHAEHLYSNEFQQERVADVGIVLDGREHSSLFAGGHSLFEHSVLAAGAVADTLLNQGNRVGLLIYSQYLQWSLPGYGRLQRERILQALSRAALGSSQIFDGLQHLPARLFPAEAQIILVSPLVEDDCPTLVQLRARGHQVMVLSPDPVAFEASHLPIRPALYSRSEVALASRIVRIEREWMLKHIRRAGVQVVEWDVLEPLDLVIRRAFGRSMRIGTRQ